jgi:HEAT repeat protein
LCVETRGDDLLDDKSNTALLALGVLGNTLRKNGGEEEYSILADNLRSKLDESANNFDMTTTTLLAIGNTGDPSFVPNIEPYFSSENPSLRATSAKALRNMDDKESLTLLADNLQEEKDSRVRLSLVKSLGNRKADEQSISTVRDLVTREKDKGVRYNLIRYLVNNMYKFPENKEALEKLLKQKNDEDSLKLILEGLEQAK